jgi:hypothetical protein
MRRGSAPGPRTSRPRFAESWNADVSRKERGRPRPHRSNDGDQVGPRRPDRGRPVRIFSNRAITESWERGGPRPHFFANDAAVEPLRGRGRALPLCTAGAKVDRGRPVRILSNRRTPAFEGRSARPRPHFFANDAAVEPLRGRGRALPLATAGAKSDHAARTADGARTADVPSAFGRIVERRHLKVGARAPRAQCFNRSVV